MKTNDADVMHTLEGAQADESVEHRLRVEKIEKLRALGIEPWPDTPEINAHCVDVINEFCSDADGDQTKAEQQVQTAVVPAEAGKQSAGSSSNAAETNEPKCYALAGRLMTIRLHGKTIFAHIQDTTCKLQIYLKADAIGADAFKHFEEFIDLGDIIYVEGTSFKTKTGEITLKVDKYQLLSKCLYPLPEKFHGLQDIEIKYRQRYLDVMTNEESRARFYKRSFIIQELRNYLCQHSYLEVETPMLHPIAGGAAAKPFITHHNALHTDFYLRIAPELYLKRLLVGGFERVYEINRNFRNEGISTRHNPEFTMLEFYTAYKDYIYGMDFVEDMLRTAAQKACGITKVPYAEYEIDFGAPFKRITIYDAVVEYGGITPEQLTQAQIDETLKKHTVKLLPDASLGQKIYALFDKLVEPKLIQPTFVHGFPIEISPLTKKDTKNPSVAPRYELFIAGMEIANSYNELNDPFDQAQRFHDQLKAHAAGDEEAHQFDADYIRALEYGLPPAVGVGIGIDRLVMLLTSTPSIKEVILFPTLKKKEQ